MLRRSLAFWEKYGPIVVDGFTFQGGYTPTISTGDGDYLTKDTMWDFKVSVRNISTEHTLQILIYYIMGMHSIHPEFKNIKKLGFYNPRLNKIYTINVSDIPKETIEDVSVDVIGYEGIKHTRVKESISAKGSTKSNKDSGDSEFFTLKDLAARLGVSSQKITKSFIPMGLPYEKVGKSYRFNKKSVLAWEIVVKQVPYGRNGYIELPDYIKFRDMLYSKYRTAKANKDKEQVAKLKADMVKFDIKIPRDYTWLWLVLAAALVCIMVYIVYKSLY